MRLLLDTCALLFFIADSDDLSPRIKALIRDPGSDVFVSAVTAAELACAADRGRLQLRSHWRSWWHDVLSQSSWPCLPVTREIVEEAFSLPQPIHRDPADRIIIGTARVESLTVVTTDRLILAYPHVTCLS